MNEVNLMKISTLREEDVRALEAHRQELKMAVDKDDPERFPPLVTAMLKLTKPLPFRALERKTNQIQGMRKL